jgi:hypothetical protein
MVMADAADEHHPDEDSDGIDQDVHGGSETARDKALMKLVAHGVGDSAHDRPPDAARCSEEQETEHGELAGVRELAQREVPLLEPRAEIRDRREGEDQSRPGHNRPPPPRHPHDGAY